MADPITSNLYPPIIDTFMPAFVINSCNVYFELSDFNTIADINTNLIQVSVRNQKNNENSLVNAGGIRYYTLHEETGTNRYYITIESSHLESGFQPNIYYKVQIRFTKSNVSTSGCYVNTPDNPSMTWINEHLNYFSEWSSVCLIRQITEPTIEQNSLVIASGNDYYEYETPFLKFSGKIKFGQGENEYLKEYRLRLYNTSDSSPFNDGTLVEDSEVQYSDRDIDVNKILYNFKAKLQSDSRYNLYINIVTNNLYQKTFEYKGFLASFENTSANTLSFTCTEDPDQGRIKLAITDSSPAPADYIVIMRSSNRSNFEKYDEIAVIPSAAQKNFYDSSIESGIWYKYEIQKYNNGTYYAVTSMQDPIMVIYEDIFLNSQGKQLKFQFDSHITSYKRTVTESKQDTLGGKYSHIRRNSATNYKQFPITGLISYLSDDEEVFITEDELYGGASNTAKYIDYNLNNRITPYIDYVKEREFREKVFDFLYSDKAFLLRTITEGLVLIRLMDVNATPNQSLNNYICTFTATAVEIGECTPENYYKYKVFPDLYSTIQLER